MSDCCGNFGKLQLAISSVMRRQWEYSPLPRLRKWVERVNEPPAKHELEAVRLSAQRGRPLGDEGWVESIA